MSQLDYVTLGIDAKEYRQIPIFIRRDTYRKFSREGKTFEEFKEFFIEGLKDGTVLLTPLLQTNEPVKIKQAVYTKLSLVAEHDKIAEEWKKEFDILIEQGEYELIP